LNPALIKPPLFLACLAPLAYYAWGAQADTLGANPIEAVTRGLGDWALNFLLITLAVTPLRKLTGWAWLGRLRRMLGLFVFFYAALHLSTYLWFDQFFDWQAIAKDILKRPFITVGMISFALLLPWRRPRMPSPSASSAAAAGRNCIAASTPSACWPCCTIRGWSRPTSAGRWPMRQCSGCCWACGSGGGCKSATSNWPAPTCRSRADA
jgi:hypothetical protein